MTSKYEPLHRHLLEQPDNEAVSLTIAQLVQLVGELPPSAARREWWANTAGHSQALAWMEAGRRVIEVRPGSAITFSPAGTPLSTPPRRRGVGRTSLVPVMDGVAALEDALTRTRYGSVVEAVSANSLFLHPDTVRQTDGQPLFPVIRDMHRRGTFDVLEDGSEVLLDDNTSPTRSFLWAANRTRGPDVQYNHVFGDPRNQATYTALWNLCVTPAFLAKTTDGSNHPEVLAALRFRVVDLYGQWPTGEERPFKPAGYERLVWLDHPPAVSDLEAVIRKRLAEAPKSRPAQAARRIGWLFSGWQPDLSIPAPE